MKTHVESYKMYLNISVASSRVQWNKLNSPDSLMFWSGNWIVSTRACTLGYWKPLFLNEARFQSVVGILEFHSTLFRLLSSDFRSGRCDYYPADLKVSVVMPKIRFMMWRSLAISSSVPTREIFLTCLTSSLKNRIYHFFLRIFRLRIIYHTCLLLFFIDFCCCLPLLLQLWLLFLYLPLPCTKASTPSSFLYQCFSPFPSLSTSPFPSYSLSFTSSADGTAVRLHFIPVTSIFFHLDSSQPE